MALQKREVQEQFVQQIKEHELLVNKICHIYAYTESDRQDLFQEIVIQLWNAYPRFKGEAKFSTWMYRVALNTAISLFRKKKDFIKTYEPASLPDNLGELILPQPVEEQFAVMHKAIGELNQLEKAIVILYLEDRSYSEMEEILGIRQVNIRVKLSRIKEKLRQLTKKLLIMELDHFKKIWVESDPKKTNTNIMELIQHKTYGPLAALKRAFKKQIRLMLIIPFILLATNINNLAGVATSIMFWSYVVFCMGIIAFASYNYRSVAKMSGMDSPVKDNLELQVTTLENRLKHLIVALRITLLYFVVLAELLPYVQHYRMLNKWHSLNPFVRYGVYAGLFILQYFFSSKMTYRKFGVHISYLKEMIREMRD